MSTVNILVTGATGFVGTHLIPKLTTAGHTVTALVRDKTTYTPPARDITVIEADLLDPSSLTGIFDGIDVVYYLVHSLKAGENFADRDRIAATNFVTATKNTPVDRVIYLGGLGETGEDLSEHLRSRQDVETTLATGHYDLTTLRAAIIIGKESASFKMIRQLANRLPLMITPRWVRTQCQPIAIQDVTTYLVGVLDVPETRNQTYEIGGPEILTYQEMLTRTAHHLGHHPFIIPVPLLTPQLSVYWIDLVTDIPKSIAHPLIYGLKNPVVVTDDRIHEIIPIELTPFDVAISRALTEPT